MKIPRNWIHLSGHHLNADGKSIVYEHTQKPFTAVVECIIQNEEDTLEYYTAIFDESTLPIQPVEAEELFQDKENAIDNLRELMEKHN